MKKHMKMHISNLNIVYVFLLKHKLMYIIDTYIFTFCMLNILTGENILSGIQNCN